MIVRYEMIPGVPHAWDKAPNPFSVNEIARATFRYAVEGLKVYGPKFRRKAFLLPLQMTFSPAIYPTEMKTPPVLNNSSCACPISWNRDHLGRLRRRITDTCQARSIKYFAFPSLNRCSCRDQSPEEYDDHCDHCC